ncbi:uncharacterized protein LOC142556903 [Primulina tabacum]|uniref:uncharacterized protein LOC142556903 n=1 Tax=Primulina tabacum TaxID=48773 RepID=UPI003F59AABE
MEQLSKSEFERFACKTWGAWQDRLRITHCTEGTSKSLLQQLDNRYIEKFWAAQHDVHIGNLGPINSSPRVWHPPPLGQFRLDIDAAFRDQQNVFGIAGVLRNSDGNLILAFGSRIEQPLSVVHAKLIALKMGLYQLRDMGFSNVQVFSNSQMAVQAVIDPSLYFGYIDSCALEIKHMVME